MAFMATGYGLRRGWRKAAIALCCGFFISLSSIAPARSASLRLLVLGDSLAAGYGLAAPDAEANLAAILDALAAAKIPVLLAGMLAPPNLGDAYAAEFAAGFARLGQRPGVIFQPFFLDGVAGDPALNQADHIHPNPTGMPIVVAHILPFVLRLLDAAR